MAVKNGSGKERVYKSGLADPRSGAERVAGLINRAATGNKAVRRYDDSPTQMAKAKAKKR